MKTFALLTRVLCATQAAAMIAGCAGSQSQSVTPSLPASASGTHSKQFGYTGRIAYFRVPAGVVTIGVDALGARGGGFAGKGGRVVAMLPVTPGERLAVLVGGEGSGTSGGFNGGADGGAGMGSGSGPGYGGGGASDVRQGGSGLSHRVLVAAGGGGLGGGINGGTGGAGGAQTGGAGRAGHGGSGGNGGGGSGGTQVAGGIGGAGGYSNYNWGANGYNGTLGSGGAGGPGCVHSFCEGGGGGGAGGGYYGGGGGGSGAVTPGSNSGSGGGGGGGSSYIEPMAMNVRFWQGWRNATGNGEITISWR